MTQLAIGKPTQGQRLIIETGALIETESLSVKSNNGHTKTSEAFFALSFDFASSDMTAERDDAHLVFVLSDGSSVVMQDFYLAVEEDRLPNFIFQDTMITGNDFLATLDNQTLLSAPDTNAITKGGRFYKHIDSELEEGVEALEGLAFDDEETIPYENLQTQMEQENTRFDAQATHSNAISLANPLSQTEAMTDILDPFIDDNEALLDFEDEGTNNISVVPDNEKGHFIGGVGQHDLFKVEEGMNVNDIFVDGGGEELDILLADFESDDVLQGLKDGNIKNVELIVLGSSLQGNSVAEVMSELGSVSGVTNHETTLQLESSTWKSIATDAPANYQVYSNAADDMILIAERSIIESS